MSEVGNVTTQEHPTGAQSVDFLKTHNKRQLPGPLFLDLCPLPPATLPSYLNYNLTLLHTCTPAEITLSPEHAWVDRQQKITVFLRVIIMLCSGG